MKLLKFFVRSSFASVIVGFSSNYSNLSRKLSSKVGSFIPGRFYSSSESARMMKVNTERSIADVYAFQMFKDNYGYILVDKRTGNALMVDPGDGEVAEDAVKQNNVRLTTILTTHKHSDHTGGNEHLQSVFPDLEFIATGYEHVPCQTKNVRDGDKIEFGGLLINVLFTPCHTSGHVSFFIEDLSSSSEGQAGKGKDPILFCGDTLFVGGCGKFFEGTAEQMLNNMNQYSNLPLNTQVFCAHEYTESNFKFLTSIDPETCEKKYHEIQKIRKEGKPTIPSSIEEEMKYNLFMRCHDKRLKDILGVENAIDAMNELRTRKNNF
jgi:hydroxyacylglutathione hydrolase